MSERLKRLFTNAARGACITGAVLTSTTAAVAQEASPPYPPIPQRASSWDGCNLEYVSPYGRTLSPNEEPNPNGALPPTPENLSLPGATIAYRACDGEAVAVYVARTRPMRVVRYVPQR